MKYTRKIDLIIIASVIVLALVALFLNRFLLTEKGVYAEIYHNSVLVYRTELSTAKESSFSVPEEPDVVFKNYADGGIAFIESDCPDQVCIRSGRLKNAGQSAACLPNGLLLKIVTEGEERKEPDLIIE